MKNKTWIASATMAVALIGLAVTPARAADVKVKTGYLTCHEASGWGFIIGSSHKIRCTYTSNNHHTEYYSGSISKFGADIGYLQSAVILWAVAAPTTDLGAGALAASGRCSYGRCSYPPTEPPLSDLEGPVKGSA
jgi:hypothetical protein